MVATTTGVNINMLNRVSRTACKYKRFPSVRSRIFIVVANDKVSRRKHSTMKVRPMLNPNLIPTGEDSAW